MTFIELPIEKAFTLVEPGPVLLVTTHDEGKNNIMTITWHTVLDFTPRIILVTGPWNFSFQALRHTKECVINIPTVDLAEKTISIGDCSGSEVDKFAKFELTPLPARGTKAPLIGECLATLECRVIEYLEDPGIFILQGTSAWIDSKRKERRTFHAVGDGTFIVDGKTLNLRHLMADKIADGV